MKKAGKFFPILAAGMILFSALAFVSCNDLLKDLKKENKDKSLQDDSRGENDFDCNVPPEYSITVRMVSEEGVESWQKFIRTSKGFYLGVPDYDSGIVCYEYKKRLAIFERNDEGDGIGWKLTSVILFFEDYDPKDFGQLFFSFNDFSDALKKQGSAEIAGHKCTKYVFSGFTYYIDDVYNICMKFEGMNESWEITEFKTSGVSLPDSKPDYEIQVQDKFAPLFGKWVEAEEKNGGFQKIEGGDSFEITDGLEMSMAGKKYDLNFLNEQFMVSEEKVHVFVPNENHLICFSDGQKKFFIKE